MTFLLAAVLMAADPTPKELTKAELTAYLESELPGMEVDQTLRYPNWTFTDKLKVVKVISLELWTVQSKIHFKCKIIDSSADVEATCYIFGSIYQIDPSDKQSWVISELGQLKVIRRVKTKIPITVPVPVFEISVEQIFGVPQKKDFK